MLGAELVAGLAGATSAAARAEQLLWVCCAAFPLSLVNRQLQTRSAQVPWILALLGREGRPQF